MLTSRPFAQSDHVAQSDHASASNHGLPFVRIEILNITVALLLAMGVLLVGCQRAEAPVETPATITEAAATTTRPSVVEVAAHDFTFDAPDQIPSGWTTFRFVNGGMEAHFFFLTQLPEGKTIDDYGKQVGGAFDKVWNALQSGTDKAEAGAMLGKLLPEWYLKDAKAMGGSGLTAAGASSQTTLNLEPGNYVMECYVKTKEGQFHVSLGMVRPLTVTTETTNAEPPKADIEISLSNAGMDVQGEPVGGEHTVAVHFNEQPAGGLGYDVHVVRLAEGQSLDQIVPWMDWMNINGLRSPAPAEFLGGTQEMPAGSTSYFTVNLTPGNYAWISEAGADKGMAKEFTVGR